MSNTKTLAANMRNAFVERRHATIGGGQFTPEELRDGAIALNAYDDMLEALKKVTVHLIAAHSLLSSGGKKAAASDKIFEHMLADYEKAFELGRATIARATGETQ